MMPVAAAPPFCAWCGARFAGDAQFCGSCGRSRSGLARSGPARWAWLAAAVLLVTVALALVLLMNKQAPPAPVAVGGLEPAPSEAADPADGATPPDISSMTPRERFDRLYNRVMRAAESGDFATVERFAPMARAAFAQLAPAEVDADARFHVAMLALHTNDAATATEQVAAIRKVAPNHLFASMLAASVAKQAGNQAALAAARRDFVQHYAAETKSGKPEYQEHAAGLQRFLDEAKAATTSR